MAPDEGPCWRDFNQAVAYRGAARLPCRCVRCNAVSTRRLKKTLYWHEPWIYLTILAGLLIYIIVAAVSRQSCVVEYTLCDKHRQHRTIGILSGVIGLVGGFVLFLWGLVENVPAAALIGLLFFVVGPIAGAILARSVSAKRIDRFFVWMKAGQPFIESLPVPPPPAYAPQPYGQAGWGTPGGPYQQGPYQQGPYYGQSQPGGDVPPGPGSPPPHHS